MAAIPERLGKYPITGMLGRGAMGVVYRGYDPVIKRPVAIKTIRKELIDQEEGTEAMSGRFRREAQAAGGLNHPGIVSVYEYGEDAQHAFIAMEFVEGNSLRDYMSRGVIFDEHDSVSIMAQLLDALQFAHQHAVWHRDIKPANIMVMSNGRIKLTDFGIARIESTDFTKTNVIMGTPGFIAPELYLGTDIDHRIDVFSAGVMFYHLLAGRPPFGGRPEAVMHDICYHDPPAPSTIDAKRCWPQYDAVIKRSLEKQPAARFPSAAAFRAAILTEYAQPLNSTLSDATIIPAPRRAMAPEGGPGSQPRSSATPAGATQAGSRATAGTSTPPPTGWSAPVLSGIEVALARFVGPVARVLVRREAQANKDIHALTLALLDAIERPEDKEAFARAVTGAGLTALRDRSGSGSGGGSGSGSSTPATPWPATAAGGPALAAAELEHTTRVLANYIGPLARVVVKRAAAACASRSDFLNQVVQSLDTDAKRERFLREVAVRGG